MRGRALALGVLLILPMAGLALLLLIPSIDVMWEHQPSHFWLVLGVALLNVILGLLANEAARQREDPRLFLVSMARIVISAATLDQLGGRATVESIGPIDLKGKAQPVETYRLISLE